MKRDYEKIWNDIKVGDFIEQWNEVKKGEALKDGEIIRAETWEDLEKKLKKMKKYRKILETDKFPELPKEVKPKYILRKNKHTYIFAEGKEKNYTFEWDRVSRSYNYIYFSPKEIVPACFRAENWQNFIK